MSARGSCRSVSSRLVSGVTCAEVAREMGVKAHVRLGKQARDDGAADSDNILGDVMEGLIGALYLEHGLEAARAFIHRAWSSRIDGKAAVPRHPKSLLHEWAEAHKRKPPIYTVIDRSGPDHALRWTVRASLGSAGEAAGRRLVEAGSRNRRRHRPLGNPEIMTQQCGLVAVIGAPNAGKSTLVNALVGQKVAIVTPKAGTTRTRLMGIAIEGEAQIMLVDTPGIFDAHPPLRPRDGAGSLGRRAGRRRHRAGGRCQARRRPQARSDRHRAGRPHRAKAADPQQGRCQRQGQAAPARPTTERAREVRRDADGLRHHGRRRGRPQGDACRAAARGSVALPRGSGQRRARTDDGGGGDARAIDAATLRRTAAGERGRSPRNMPSATTDRSKSTSRSWSNATASAPSSSARAAHG